IPSAPSPDNPHPRRPPSPAPHPHPPPLRHRAGATSTIVDPANHLRSRGGSPPPPAVRRLEPPSFCRHPQAPVISWRCSARCRSNLNLLLLHPRKTAPPAILAHELVVLHMLQTTSSLVSTPCNTCPNTEAR
uniref:Uncharacterized protein n=2 Tax=Aegilops tauschii subsp. strangulata TaxID=200361 RepID=A0A453NWU3_AEGTS